MGGKGDRNKQEMGSHPRGAHVGKGRPSTTCRTHSGDSRRFDPAVGLSPSVPPGDCSGQGTELRQAWPCSRRASLCVPGPEGVRVLGVIQEGFLEEAWQVLSSVVPISSSGKTVAERRGPSPTDGPAQREGACRLPTPPPLTPLQDVLKQALPVCSRSRSRAAGRRWRTGAREGLYLRMQGRRGASSVCALGGCSPCPQQGDPFGPSSSHGGESRGRAASRALSPP